jgi:hypothetical protein
MKGKIIVLFLGIFTVILLYYRGGPLSNALLPGFYLSAFLTVRDHAAFGRAYVLVGLAINSIIFFLAIVLLCQGIAWIFSRRAGKL